MGMGCAMGRWATYCPDGCGKGQPKSQSVAQSKGQGQSEGKTRAVKRQGKELVTCDVGPGSLLEVFMKFSSDRFQRFHRTEAVFRVAGKTPQI